MMELHDFYYDLPQELIAQDPLSDRSASRLMLLDKNTGEIEHKIFKDIIDYLNPGDCLVINDTKVIPARLIGERVGTGATIEVLLLKRKEDMKDVWEVLVKPGKKAKIGTKISFGDGRLVAEVIDIVEEGNRLIQFTYEGIFEEILDELGQMPLPPYITHKLPLPSVRISPSPADIPSCLFSGNRKPCRSSSLALHFCFLNQSRRLYDAVPRSLTCSRYAIHRGIISPSTV